jgi:L-seryl-tRNA(Ser) seleniumtransferase
MANRSSLRNPIYQELGVRTIIQASGTKTSYSGPRLDDEVIEAMQQASKSSVDIVELNKKVGEYIAQITHSEAGMVTSGAASGIVLSTAACMTGNNPAKAKKLPDASDMKNEVIMQKIHRGHYSHLYTHAGAKIIEVGDLVSVTAHDMEYAINEKTAAINFLIGPKIYQTGLSFEAVAAIAQKNKIPLIVDAAAMLPPKENLWKYIEAGADLVTFSGGKIIRGPQNSGLLFGKKELVEAAMLNASPNNAIGRAHKLSKEDIVGLYTALKKFMQCDEEELYRQCREKIQRITPFFEPLHEHIALAIEHDFHEFSVPVLLVSSKSVALNMEKLAGLLKNHDPAIYLEYHKRSQSIVIHPFALEYDEPEIVGEEIAGLIKSLL